MLFLPPFDAPFYFPNIFVLANRITRAFCPDSPEKKKLALDLILVSIDEILKDGAQA